MVGNDKWLTNDTETPFSDQQEQACPGEKVSEWCLC